MKKVSVIGAGGWGTALAIHLFNQGHSVTLWENFPEYAKLLNEKRENIKFLPRIKIPEEIEITIQMEQATQDAEVIILAIPSKYFREVGKRIEKFPKDSLFISVAKGIEQDTLLRMSQVVQEILTGAKVGVLSGPSHAEEVAFGIPTTVVCASKEENIAQRIQDIFMGRNLRVYTNPDVIGVELGGALKNIIALACGISDGLGYGDNTKTALMTRGLAEISRLGVKMGASPHTFAGLSGMGDMIVTCTSKYSRNRKVGEEIGQGKKLQEILESMEMVAEGIWTTKSALKLAENYQVDMPITSAVYEILWKDKDPRSAVNELMSRNPKAEIQ